MTIQAHPRHWHHPSRAAGLGLLCGSGPTQFSQQTGSLRSVGSLCPTPFADLVAEGKACQAHFNPYKMGPVWARKIAQLTEYLRTSVRLTLNSQH